MTISSENDLDKLARYLIDSTRFLWGSGHDDELRDFLRKLHARGATFGDLALAVERRGPT
jgi:hypothetical protein